MPSKQQRMQRPQPVSIRARPFGRAMRRQGRRQSADAGCFNPRPAFRPGDAPCPTAMLRAWPSFNPRPAFRPGDARRRPTLMWRYTVSIRARPFGRAMPLEGLQAVRSQIVSIRARPFGRAMPETVSDGVSMSRSFNPRPAFRPGDAKRRDGFSHYRRCFNPRPAFRPGDALLLQHVDSKVERHKLART